MGCGCFWGVVWGDNYGMVWISRILDYYIHGYTDSEGKRSQGHVMELSPQSGSRFGRQMLQTGPSFRLQRWKPTCFDWRFLTPWIQFYVKLLFAPPQKKNNKQSASQIVFWLGGSFKYFLFSPLPWEIIQFDEHIFQMGWFKHQPVEVSQCRGVCCFTDLGWSTWSLEGLWHEWWRSS